MSAPNIAVAIPAYGGSIKNECVKSLLALQGSFLKSGWPFRYFVLDVADITLVRNVFATMVLQDETLTHLLFIDSDMKFRPEAVFRMYALQKPIVGCACPRREIHFKRLAEIGTTSPLSSALSQSLDFNILFTSDRPTMKVKNGAAEISGIGMGLTLIDRRVLVDLQSLVAIHKSHGLINSGFDRPALGFFDPLSVGDTRLGEDYSFCWRWREAGGEVWSLVDERIGHVGSMTYEGMYAEKLRSGDF